MLSRFQFNSPNTSKNHAYLYQENIDNSRLCGFGLFFYYVKLIVWLNISGKCLQEIIQKLTSSSEQLAVSSEELTASAEQADQAANKAISGGESMKKAVS